MIITLQSAFRASHRGFTHEPQPCCLSSDVFDVSCSSVADFVPTLDISMANHGH